MAKRGSSVQKEEESEGRRACRLVSEEVAERAVKDPKSVTFTCVECGKKYIAKSMCDMYVCPLCGSIQHDEYDE